MKCQKWQHYRCSRNINNVYYLSVALAKKYIRFAVGKENGKSYLYVYIYDSCLTPDTQIAKSGNFHMPVKYSFNEYISIDQSIENPNMFRICNATEEQIQNEYMHRIVGKPTGWVQKKNVITIRDEEILFLLNKKENDGVFGDMKLYKREVYGSNPMIMVCACNVNPGPEWRIITRKMIDKKLFTMSQKYERYVNITRNIQLRYRKFDNLLLNGKGLRGNCICFLSPDINDAVTGDVLNETEDVIIRYKVKDKAEKNLSTLRDYISETDKEESLSKRLNDVIKMIRSDENILKDISDMPEYQNLFAKRAKRIS